jgi:plastocyanin
MPVRLVLAACLAAVVLPAAAAHGDNPVLDGVVSDDSGFSISLKSGGTPVTHLDPGTYTIRVHDPAVIHDFHLKGPGVDVATSVEGKEDVTWTVTFVDGIYRFFCDPHNTVMKGAFAVGTAKLPPPATTLRASVGPGRTIALKFTDGSRVRTVTTTQVKIVLDDRSRTDNFHLTGQGVNKATGVGFRGKVTWKLSLPGSKYVFRSDRHKSLRGSFVVAATGYR